MHMAAFLAEDNAKTSVPHQRKVWCYPIQFALPCPRLPIVEFHQDKEITSLRYKGEVMKLNNIYFNKLVRNILDINLKLTFYKRQLVRAISPTIKK